MKFRMTNDDYRMERSRVGVRAFVIRHSSFVVFLLLVGLLHAAPAQKPADDIPPLAPPLPELPPTVWEQFGWTLWFLIPLALAVAGLVLVLWLRPRRPPQLPAPAAQARAALSALQARPEDGATLSQISQTLRRYLVTAFWLRPEQMTTTEFCTALAAHKQIGPELSAALAEFLRGCDERKFAPAASPPALGAAGRALELVELAEAHRAKLRAQLHAAQSA